NEANIGQYSPTEVLIKQRASDVIETLADQSVDLKRAVVAGESLPRDLVPGALQEFTVESGQFRVRATSTGRSILVLPMEFSQCLRVVSNVAQSSAPPRLFRANLLLTGVLFEGALDATISYRTGPGRGARCRLRDGDDMKAIDIKDVFEKHPEFIPTAGLSR